MMKATAWIGLWGLTALTGFALGMVIGKATRPQIQPRQPVVATTKKQDDPQRSRLLASLETLRKTLSEKEQTADDLRAEIDEVRTTWVPLLSPEMERLRETEVEYYSRRRRSEARWKRQDELEEKILQRRDKALRAEGILELAALLQSDDPEELLPGLSVFLTAHSLVPQVERERFNSRALAALEHPDGGVRESAMDFLPLVCSEEALFDTSILMLNDGHVWVRRTALRHVLRFRGSDRNDEAVAALMRVALDDEELRGEALSLMKEMADKGYDFGPGLDDFLVEISRNPRSRVSVLAFWEERKSLSQQVIQRYTEILEAPWDEWRRDMFLHPPRCEEARHVAFQCCLRVLRESRNSGARRKALENLRSLGDDSIVPELESFASSEDVRGIERDLARTIEFLTSQGGQAGNTSGASTERDREVD